MFSLHTWWTDSDVEARIKRELEESVAMGLPLIVGEFGGVSVDCNIAFPYKTLIAECQKNDIGYLPWSWGPQNTCAAHSMSTNDRFDSLRPWGREVLVTDPNSIKNTSVIPYSIRYGTCKP